MTTGSCRGEAGPQEEVAPVTSGSILAAWALGTLLASFSTTCGSRMLDQAPGGQCL